MSLIRLSDQDNVAVATGTVQVGEKLVVGDAELVARDAIPFAHKMALRPIAPGEKVIKFGVPIGSATVPIEAGDHVHVHNIKSDYVNNEVDFFELAEGESSGSRAVKGAVS